MNGGGEIAVGGAIFGEKTAHEREKGGEVEAVACTDEGIGGPCEFQDGEAAFRFKAAEDLLEAGR